MSVPVSISTCPRIRAMLLATPATVLPFGLVAAVGLAFAWPSLPRSAPGGAVLASYAPVANGDSTLLVRYGPGGGVLARESQNVAVIPGMRAMTVDLGKAGQDALQKFLLGETERDTTNRLSDALVVEVRTRTLTAGGTLTSGSQLSLREARGDFLLSLWGGATDNDSVFEPPLRTMPADPRAEPSWQSRGKLGVADYHYTARLLGETTGETGLGRFEDCLELEARMVLSRDGTVLLDNLGVYAYCAGAPGPLVATRPERRGARADGGRRQQPRARAGPRLAAAAPPDRRGRASRRAGRLEAFAPGPRPLRPSSSARRWAAGLCGPSTATPSCGDSGRAA